MTNSEPKENKNKTLDENKTGKKGLGVKTLDLETNDNTAYTNLFHSSTGRRAITSSSRSNYLRTKDKIPVNFHQRIIELENNFINNKNLEVISELLPLYKIGVEYFSGKCTEKQKAYLDRMQSFLRDKNVIKCMKLNSVHPQTTKNKSKFSSQLISESNRNSLFFSVKIKIYKTTFNSKDFLKKFDYSFSQGCYLIEEGLKEQKIHFMENLKNKIFRQNLKSDSKINRRNQSFIRRKHYAYNSHSPNKFKSIIEDFSPIKKIDFIELNNPCLIYINSKANYDEIDKSCLSKIKKSKFISNKKHVGKIIDSYLSSLHHLYYQKFFDEALKDSTKILDKGYEMKKKNYEEYSDQTLDIEYMKIENNDELIKSSYSQLLNSLRSDSDKELIKITREINLELNSLISDYRGIEVSNDIEIGEAGEFLLDHLVRLLK